MARINSIRNRKPRKLRASKKARLIVKRREGAKGEKRNARHCKMNDNVISVRPWHAVGKGKKGATGPARLPNTRRVSRRLEIPA